MINKPIQSVQLDSLAHTFASFSKCTLGFLLQSCSYPVKQQYISTHRINVNHNIVPSTLHSQFSWLILFPDVQLPQFARRNEIMYQLTAIKYFIFLFLQLSYWLSLLPVPSIADVSKCIAPTEAANSSACSRGTQRRLPLANGCHD